MSPLPKQKASFLLGHILHQSIFAYHAQAYVWEWNTATSTIGEQTYAGSDSENLAPGPEGGVYNAITTTFSPAVELDPDK